MPQEKLICPNCGIPIRWTPFWHQGQAFCWQGCAKGDPVPRLRFEVDPIGRDTARFVRPGA